MAEFGPERETEPVKVRVTTTGNSRALPVPAAFARRHHADPGTQWELREVGSALVYEPVETSERVTARSYGEGRDRVTVIPAEALSSPSDPTDPDLTTDWSF